VAVRFRMYLCDERGKLWRLPRTAVEGRETRAFPQYAGTQQKDVHASWTEDEYGPDEIVMLGSYIAFDKQGRWDHSTQAASAALRSAYAKQLAAGERQGEVPRLHQILEHQATVREFEQVHRWKLGDSQEKAVIDDICGDHRIPVLKAL
jgi:hypothetical protein